MAESRGDCSRPVLVAQKLFADGLQRDRAPYVGVERLVDDSHRALAQLPQDRILSEALWRTMDVGKRVDIFSPRDDSAAARRAACDMALAHALQRLGNCSKLLCLLPQTFSSNGHVCRPKLEAAPRRPGRRALAHLSRARVEQYG